MYHDEAIQLDIKILSTNWKTVYKLLYILEL